MNPTDAHTNLLTHNPHLSVQEDSAQEAQRQNCISERDSQRKPDESSYGLSGW